MSFLGHVDKKLTDMAKNSEFEALEESALETAAMPYDKVKDKNYAIRPAKSLKEVQEFWWPLVRDLGWNRGFNDTTTHLHLAGNDAFLILVSKPDDKPVGCTVAYCYDNGTGWLGYFMVDESVRGKGWGGAIFSAAMEHYRSKNISIVGLDGVEEQVSTYGRRGFKKTTTIQIVVRPTLKDRPLQKKPNAVDGVTPEEELKDIREIPFEWLVESDAAHTGFKRQRLWSNEGMFARDDAWGFAITSRKYHALLAWTLVRSCHEGYRVGPVYADTEAQASALVQEVLKKVGDVEGKTLTAEVFAPSEKGLKVFKDLGWDIMPVEYHRMWLDGVVAKPQRDGGRAGRGMYAIFDASTG